MKYPPTWIFSLINYFTLETYQPYILNKITHTKKYSYQHYIFNRIPTTPKKYSYQPYILIKITQKKKKNYSYQPYILNKITSIKITPKYSYQLYILNKITPPTKKGSLIQRLDQILPQWHQIRNYQAKRKQQHAGISVVLREQMHSSVQLFSNVPHWSCYEKSRSFSCHWQICKKIRTHKQYKSKQALLLILS